MGIISSSTLTQFLDYVTRYLSPALLSPEAKENVYAIARQVFFGHVSGFECRLGEGESQVDFQMAYVPGLSLPSAFLENPVWQLIDAYGDFLLTIPADERSPLKLILEFDCAQPVTPMPVPSVFLALEKAEPGKPQDIVAESEQLLPEDVPCTGMLDTISGTLQESARVTYLGFMLARPENAVRVNIAGLDGRGAAAYLKLLGWKSGTTELERLFGLISPLFSRLILAIDLVEERVSPRLGLELFSKFDPVNPKAQWDPLLDICVFQNWCTIEKAAGLKNWIGVSQPGSDAENWPPSLKALEGFMGAGAYSLLYRYVNHLKLVYTPGLPVEAKAYLGFAHRWLDKARIRKAIDAVRNQSDE